MMKILRGTPKHLSQSGKLEGFTYLMLTIPYNCNYNCLKCFNIVDRSEDETHKYIPRVKIFNKIEEAKKLGGKSVIIAGEGEPSLDRNIRDFITAINEAGMIPIVYSNGSTLNSELAEFYRKNNACLVIALDSLCPDIYQTLTGTRRNLLPMILENINGLRQIYADTIEENNGNRVVRLALNMTICSKNKDEIGKIKEFAGDEIYFVSNPIAHYGNAIANWPDLIDDENVFATLQDLILEYSESGGPLTLDSTGCCGYSKNGIGIDPSGNYMTCAYTDKTNGLLGTIEDTSLEEAYRAKHWVESNHYKQYGMSPCLVRDKAFNRFLDALQSKTFAGSPN